MVRQRNICDEVRDDLVAYLDGELDPVARHAVENHLHGCPDCRRICDELRQAWRLIEEADYRTPPHVSPDFAQKVGARALEQNWRGLLGRLVRMPAARRVFAAASAAAAAVLFLVGVYSTTASPEDKRDLSPVEQQCVRYLDLLKDLNVVEHMEMVRSVQAVGRDSDLQDAIQRTEPEDWGFEVPVEDAGV